MRRRVTITRAAIGLGFCAGLVVGCAPIEHDLKKWLTGDAGSEEDSGAIDVDTDDATDDRDDATDESASDDGGEDSGGPQPTSTPTLPR
jgi:hypothetical protein